MIPQLNAAVEEGLSVIGAGPHCFQDVLNSPRLYMYFLDLLKTYTSLHHCGFRVHKQCNEIFDS